MKSNEVIRIKIVFLLDRRIAEVQHSVFHHRLLANRRLHCATHWRLLRHCHRCVYPRVVRVVLVAVLNLCVAELQTAVLNAFWVDPRLSN